MSLSLLGWDAAWADLFTHHAPAGLTPARVTVQHNHIYNITTCTGAACGLYADGEVASSVSTDVSGNVSTLVELRAEVAGKLRHAAAGAQELPAVGDWVAVHSADGAHAIIHAVLPRRSTFSRKAAGRGAAEQVCAANVDTVLLVAGLDNDFSPRRVERYLVMAWESGAAPVIVLNKRDLCGDAAARLAEIEAVAAGVRVLVTSALQNDGVQSLAAYVGPGRTVALLGSSGVGKSTLINRLLGAEVLPTQPVRESDSRGRHTTMRRELLLVPGGGMVIDTPGMRELQLLDADEGLHVTFDEIETLAADCRFSDCTHLSEPGCAVREAVRQGIVDAARLASFHKMQRELAWLNGKQDRGAAAEQKRKWKVIHKAARAFHRDR